MEQTVNWEKVYVDTLVRHTKDGGSIPLSIKFSDGKTFATRLCESGTNIKVIQDVLGHADVSTTMNIYVDVTNELKKNELKSFSAYMEGA